MINPRWWIARIREIRALLMIVVVELACLIALVTAAVMGWHHG